MFQISVNRVYQNKEYCQSYKDMYSYNDVTGKLTVPVAPSQHMFEPHQITFDDFEQIIKSGIAVAPAHFRENHRQKTNFIKAQTILLDMDKGQTIEQSLNSEFYQQYGFAIYTSPSFTEENQRHRIVFVLDEPIEDLYYYEGCVLWLVENHYPSVDRSTINGANQFYGSTDCQFYRNDKTIPLSLFVVEKVEPKLPPPRITLNPELLAEIPAKFIELEITGAIEYCTKLLKHSMDGEKHHNVLKAGCIIGGYTQFGVNHSELWVNRLSTQLTGVKNWNSANKTFNDGVGYTTGTLPPNFFERLERWETNNFAEQFLADLGIFSNLLGDENATDEVTPFTWDDLPFPPEKPHTTQSSKSDEWPVEYSITDTTTTEQKTKERLKYIGDFYWNSKDKLWKEITTEEISKQCEDLPPLDSHLDIKFKRKPFTFNLGGYSYELKNTGKLIKFNPEIEDYIPVYSKFVNLEIERKQTDEFWEGCFRKAFNNPALLTPFLQGLGHLLVCSNPLLFILKGVGARPFYNIISYILGRGKRSGFAMPSYHWLDINTDKARWGYYQLHFAKSVGVTFSGSPNLTTLGNLMSDNPMKCQYAPHNSSVGRVTSGTNITTNCHVLAYVPEIDKNPYNTITTTYAQQTIVCDFSLPNLDDFKKFENDEFLSWLVHRAIQTTLPQIKLEQKKIKFSREIINSNVTPKELVNIEQQYIEFMRSCIEMQPPDREIEGVNTQTLRDLTEHFNDDNSAVPVQTATKITSLCGFGDIPLRKRRTGRFGGNHYSNIRLTQKGIDELSYYHNLVNQDS